MISLTSKIKRENAHLLDTKCLNEKYDYFGYSTCTLRGGNMSLRIVGHKPLTGGRKKISKGPSRIGYILDV